MIRVAYVTTAGMSARYLMAGQLASMREHGYDVQLFSAGGVDQDVAASREGVPAVAIPFEREISPLRDLRALLKLFVALRRFRPAIVNAGTPKAALLGMIAATLLRLPVRIYVLRGLRAETTRGARRFVLETLERVTAACASRIVCVSPSLRDAYLQRGLTLREKTVVLGAGSSNGVEAARFRRNLDARSQLRRELGFNDDDVAIGFIGRLTRDKGIDDLLAAFERVLQRAQSARLLVIGDAETGDALSARTVETLGRHPRITRLAHVGDVASYYSAIDILAFPSSREGFPNVVLEAASASVPAVGYRVTGTIDAIEDGVTGALVRAGDIDAFADALVHYANDADLRTRHGQAGRMRVEASFSPEEIWKALRELYEQELRRRAPERLA
jgi:glycosyltransferase involved in cell wall biosynthesis